MKKTTTTNIHTLLSPIGGKKEKKESPPKYTGVGAATGNKPGMVTRGVRKKMAEVPKQKYDVTLYIDQKFRSPEKKQILKNPGLFRQVQRIMEEAKTKPETELENLRQFRATIPKPTKKTAGSLGMFIAPPPPPNIEEVKEIETLQKEVSELNETFNTTLHKILEDVKELQPKTEEISEQLENSKQWTEILADLPAILPTTQAIKERLDHLSTSDDKQKQMDKLQQEIKDLKETRDKQWERKLDKLDILETKINKMENEQDFLVTKEIKPAIEELQQDIEKISSLIQYKNNMEYNNNPFAQAAPAQVIVEQKHEPQRIELKAAGTPLPVQFEKYQKAKGEEYAKQKEKAEDMVEEAEDAVIKAAAKGDVLREKAARKRLEDAKELLEKREDKEYQYLKKLKKVEDREIDRILKKSGEKGLLRTAKQKAKEKIAKAGYGTYIFITLFLLGLFLIAIFAATYAQEKYTYYTESPCTCPCHAAKTVQEPVKKCRKLTSKLDRGDQFGMRVKTLSWLHLL